MLRALKDLEEEEGLSFDISYSRGPFFLMGDQEQINADKAKYGLPPDADNLAVTKAKYPNDWQTRGQHFDRLIASAGLSPRNKDVTDHRISAQTMSAHRLAQYAATESNEKGELVWIALSRRWFMGKDTNIRPIRLDSRELLLECATVAGLNMDNVHRVLDGEIIDDASIIAEVDKVHRAGIHSIPQLIFEVEGLANGSWLTDPTATGRVVHGGSGSKETMKAAILQCHHAAA